MTKGEDVFYRSIQLTVRGGGGGGGAENINKQ